MSSRRSLLLIALLALCAAAAGAWLAHSLHGRAPQLASGTWLDTPRDPGALALTDDAGTPFGAARLRGAPTLVFFGFTHCPDVCPTTLYLLTQLQRAGVAPHLRIAFVSIDPGRDSPAVLHQYLHGFASGGDLVGLTGSETAVAAAARSFGVAYGRIPLPGGDYTMDHSAVVFLLDRAGRIVAIFSPPFNETALAQDLRRVAPFLGA
jgi:protein SCO1